MTIMKKIIIGICLNLSLISCEYKNTSQNSKTLRRSKDISQNTKNLGNSKNIKTKLKNIKTLDNSKQKPKKDDWFMCMLQKINSKNCTDSITYKTRKIVISPEEKKELMCVIDTIFTMNKIHIEKKHIGILKRFKVIFKTIDINRCPKNFRNSLYEFSDTLDEYLNRGKNFNTYKDLIYLESFFKGLIDRDLTTTYKKVQKEQSNINKKILNAMREYKAIESRYVDIIDESGDSDFESKIMQYKIDALAKIVEKK